MIPKMYLGGKHSSHSGGLKALNQLDKNARYMRAARAKARVGKRTSNSEQREAITRAIRRAHGLA